MKWLFYLLILCFIPFASQARGARGFKGNCYLKYTSNTNEEMIARVIARNDSELTDSEELIIKCYNKKCAVPIYISNTPFRSCLNIYTTGGYLFIFGENTAYFTGISVYKTISNETTLILKDWSANGFNVYRKNGKIHVISYRYTDINMKYEKIDYILGDFMIKPAQ